MIGELQKSDHNQICPSKRSHRVILYHGITHSEQQRALEAAGGATGLEQHTTSGLFSL